MRYKIIASLITQPHSFTLETNHFVFVIKCRTIYLQMGDDIAVGHTKWVPFPHHTSIPICLILELQSDIFRRELKWCGISMCYTL